LQTLRKEMIEELAEEELTAMDLSQRLGVQEKEVYSHLSHIAKTLAAQGKKLVVDPPRCMSCGFVFGDKKSFTRPGRCPKCKEQRIRAPRFRVK
jgi:hypothetical protein